MNLWNGVRILSVSCKVLLDLCVVMFSPFRRETKSLKFASFFRAINGALFLCAIALVNLLVFSTYVATGHKLNAEVLFFVVGLFMAIRPSFIIFFGNGVMYLKQASVSEKRLQVLWLIWNNSPTVREGK